MYWNNDLKLANSEEKSSIEIYEIGSEARINGTMEYFDGNLTIGPLISASETEFHIHQIKARYPSDVKYSVDDASPDGYYHMGGVADEFASLLSLQYRARFYHISTTGGELTATRAQWRNTNSILRVGVPKSYDDVVFSTQPRSFTEFTGLLDKIDSLPEEYHLRVINAASNYNAALRQIGIDPEMVFVKLVSAIEVLSKDYMLTASDDLIKDSGIISSLEKLSSDESKELLDTLKVRKTKRKFIRFIEEYSKGYFKGGNYAAKHLKIRRSDLYHVLSVIYDARSKYLHEGESMYLSTPYADFNWDRDASVGMYIGKRYFTAKQQLPNIKFFEGLIRHCILGYIEKHTTK